MCDTSLFLFLRCNLCELLLSLGLVSLESLLPQDFYVPFVLLLADSPLLLVHLLELLVLSEFLHQFCFELSLKSAVFCFPLRLEKCLLLSGFLELFALIFLLLLLLLFSERSSELLFLVVELIAQVLLELLAPPAFHLLGLEPPEDLLFVCFKRILLFLDLILTFLLLLGILANHLILKLFKFPLSLKHCFLFFHTQNHVSLSLIHLLPLQLGLSLVVLDQALHCLVYHVSFPFELQSGVFFALPLLTDLVSKAVPVLDVFLDAAGLGLSVELLLHVLDLEHGRVDFRFEFLTRIRGVQDLRSPVVGGISFLRFGRTVPCSSALLSLCAASL